jgi:DNA-binding transcriptional MerR regulator
MNADSERRYRIGEVSKMTGIAVHLLRQWEEKFPQLKPGRDRGGRRFYYTKEIEVARRINYLLRHEKMTTEGARIRLAQELHGEGRPRTRREVIDLLDRLESEIRSINNLLDHTPPPENGAG